MAHGWHNVPLIVRVAWNSALHLCKCTLEGGIQSRVRHFLKITSDAPCLYKILGNDALIDVLSDLFWPLSTLLVSVFLLDCDKDMSDCEGRADESVICSPIRRGVQLALILPCILSACLFVHARNALKKSCFRSLYWQWCKQTSEFCL